MKPIIFFAASTRGFYHRSIHGEAIPADAVEISAALHSELFDAQEHGGKILIDAAGQPFASPPVAPTADQQRARLVALVKLEARHRIEAAVPIWRQVNDATALALQSVGDPDFDAAAGRRAAIDAIRATSGRIEATIAALDEPAITDFDPRADALWVPDTLFNDLEKATNK
jgi:hypothetical protein